MFFSPESFGKEYADYMKKMEATFVENMNSMIRDPQVLESANKSMEAGLEGKKHFDKYTHEYLEKMNMPSRQDIAKVLQYLQSIESRILDLEEKIEDLTDMVEKQNKSKSKKTAAKKTAKSKSKEKGSKES